MRRERGSEWGGERERETKRGTFSCVWRIRERGEHFKRFEGKHKWKKGRMKGGPEIEEEPWKETMCTSDSCENPANAEGISAGTFVLFRGRLSARLCFPIQIPTPRVPWPFPNISNEWILGYSTSNYAIQDNFNSEQIYYKVLIRIRTSHAYEIYFPY